MCGGTPDGKGGLWVAQRVPAGEIFVTANTFRIREVDPGNPDQMYSANLFDIAQENGWWNESEGKLDWLSTVSDGEYSHPYYSLARVWSLYSRIAPSRNFTPYVTDTYSREYPFSLKPDKLLTTADAFALFRDHYEGTVFDLTTGFDAGPFGNPYRWRGQYDDHNAFAFGEVKPGAWPRAVSEMFCGYSYINQGRRLAPRPHRRYCLVWFRPAGRDCLYSLLCRGHKRTPGMVGKRPVHVQPQLFLVGMELRDELGNPQLRYDDRGYQGPAAGNREPAVCRSAGPSN